ncbi:MAG TPA: hypothetical protein VHR66_26570 [Gemmataceae bacterium]|jgi:hypothetical protein|nr:hypothetical protein [Gemmataceae bacterium]
MTNAPIAPTADDLFQKWKQFLERGSSTTTSVVVVGPPDVTASPYRIRIFGEDSWRQSFRRSGLFPGRHSDAGHPDAAIGIHTRT